MEQIIINYTLINTVSTEVILENTEELLSIRLDEHPSGQYEGEPPNIDRWLAASALQKAVRRGTWEGGVR